MRQYIRLLLKFIYLTTYIYFRKRSPLNIIYAGLDMLKHEMISEHCSTTNEDAYDLEDFKKRRSVEMLDEIYEASEAAIEILNDLLQYEHIDSGIDAYNP